MPGSAHEVLLASIHDRPALLEALLTRMRGASLPPGLAPVDSNVRFVKAAEVRPDLLLAGEGEACGPWAIVELQRTIDPDKQRRWLLAVSVLLDQTGVLGDLIVITARRGPSRAWARRVAHVVTTARRPASRSRPIVLHLGASEVTLLLDEQHPGLALFAAWAMHHRHGPGARARWWSRRSRSPTACPRPLPEAQMHADRQVC